MRIVKAIRPLVLECCCKLQVAHFVAICTSYTGLPRLLLLLSPPSLGLNISKMDS